MIKLRLRRMGAKKRPSYRMVVADSRSPRDGRFIEIVGFYDPLTDPATIRVNEERTRHWLSVGAQPTETVRDILRRAGVLGDLKAGSAAVDDAAAAESAVAAEGAAPAKRRTRKPAVTEAPVAPATA